MMIIGLTGTIWAGKGTIAQYLLSNHNFQHYQVRDVLTQELTKQDLPVTRDTMREMANHLRNIYGSEYIVSQLRSLAQQSGSHTLIESIRTVWEIHYLRSLWPDVRIRWIDADQELRYQRITKRKSATDYVTFQEFCDQECQEMENNDTAKQNLTQCLQLADHVLMNNESVEELYHRIDRTLSISGYQN